jgi:hypothetical protein
MGNFQHDPDEILSSNVRPPPKACQDCKNRPSINPYTGNHLDRADTDICTVFVDPHSKPDDVYFNGASCPHYIKAE